MPFDELFVDRMLVLLDEDGPAGFALVRDLAETPWTFLRYYAVGRRGRGHRVGDVARAHRAAARATAGPG